MTKKNTIINNCLDFVVIISEGRKKSDNDEYNNNYIYRIVYESKHGDYRGVIEDKGQEAAYRHLWRKIREMEGFDYD